MNLYRKYRSQKFSDLVGQEHVVQVISNAVKESKIGHAYLFSGPRGIGKTSIARLLAKSLNCKKRKISDHEPCDDCQSCKEIIAGTSMDVIEIDAASNRGIDEIRELRDKIKFAPSGNKYKIFIIDEVHMLTKEAFNALLKTLEEPPAHAVFVLATTELHKVPDTIISRTQQFDFRRANIVNLIVRLKHVANAEKINIDEESLKLIARASEGSYRDAISILDQVSGTAKKITVVETRSVLGLSEWQTTIDFLDLVIAGKTKEIFDMMDKIYLEGVDFFQFASDLIDLIRRIMLAKIGYFDILDSFNDEQKKQISDITGNWQMGDFMRYIKIFDQAKREMKTASMVQLPLEMAVLELTQNIELKAQNNPARLQLAEADSVKVQTEEQKSVSNIKHHVSSEKKSKDKKSIIQNTKKPNKKVEVFKKDKISEKSIIDLNQFKKEWAEIIEKLISKNHSLSILLKDSQPQKFNDNILVVAIPFKFYKDRLEGRKIYAEVCEIIQDHVSISNLQLKFEIDNSLIGKKSSQNYSSSSVEQSDSSSELLNDAMEVFGE